MGHARRDQHGLLAALIRPVFNQPGRDEARARLSEAVEQLERPLPKVARMLERAEEEILAFYTFPQEHWRKLRSTGRGDNDHATWSVSPLGTPKVLADIAKDSWNDWKRWCDNAAQFDYLLDYLADVGPIFEIDSPQLPIISDLLIDPDVPNRLWATFSTPGAVFRSDDGGASWEDATQPARDRNGRLTPQHTPVNAIAVDPANADRVWVACDVDVFESRDAGRSWGLFGTGLPKYHGRRSALL